MALIVGNQIKNVNLKIKALRLLTQQMHSVHFSNWELIHGL